MCFGTGNEKNIRTQAYPLWREFYLREIFAFRNNVCQFQAQI
jgi:hypothetical protein